MRGSDGNALGAIDGRSTTHRNQAIALLRFVQVCGGAHSGLSGVGGRLVKHGYLQAGQRIQGFLQNSGGFDALVGHDQRPLNADPLALLLEKLDSTKLELDLGNVVDESHDEEVSLWIASVMQGKSHFNNSSMNQSTRANPHTLLTPAMQKILKSMERAAGVPLHAMSPQQARQAYESHADVLELPKQELARVESFTVLARDGHDIPVRLYAPSEGVHGVLVYFHGGGFTIGSIGTHDLLCRRLCHQSGCAVLSVGYRLAPEHKFPVAFEDAWDCVAWVAQHGASQRLDGSRLAVGGDSAGGTLAAACAIQARDQNMALALQLLIYPGTIGHQDKPSHKMFASGFVLEEPHITYFFNHYVRTAADRDDWRFAPLDGLRPDGFTADLSGVAPAWVGLAECDPLVDEGVEYADALRMAGVAVDLEIYRGVVHEFIKMGRALPEAVTAVADAARALKAALG